MTHIQLKYIYNSYKSLTKSKNSYLPHSFFQTYPMSTIDYKKSYFTNVLRVKESNQVDPLHLKTQLINVINQNLQTNEKSDKVQIHSAQI